MALAAGKVWLVGTITPLSGTCPTGAVDQVSYGTTATNCGFHTTATLTNTTAAVRGDSGCAYTGDLSVDFTTRAPAPRNSDSATHLCEALPLGPLDHVTISGPATVTAGNSIQLTAFAQDANNQTVPTATISWSSKDDAIATVDQTGRVTGVAASSTPDSITATAVGGGTPYSFVSHSIFIEAPVAAPLSIYAVNDEFGDPTPATTSDPNDLLIARPQYTLSYNESRGTPNWVSYELDARQMVTGQDRCNCFTADPTLPADKQIFTSDYTNGGSDRGHMTCSADRTAGNVDNATTIYLTNGVPH